MKKLLVAVIAMVGFLLSTADAQSVKISAETLAKRDTIGYDAIGTTRYLITMSRDYYGNSAFWPYIYIENQAKFGHPDKIEPGTTVVIPNLKKYGVNPKDPADIEKANKLGKEIYARYGKNYVK